MQNLVTRQVVTVIIACNRVGRAVLVAECKKLRIDIRDTNANLLTREPSQESSSIFLIAIITLIALCSNRGTAFHVLDVFPQLQRMGLHKFVPADDPNRLEL